ncbi:MAG: DUF998 domain-containing protein [Caulobacterales bacterium]|nr:DUF998 domain-containing protein [Caulobacterales bacterium]
MRDSRFLFGPLGALVLLVGVGGLALLVPGYDPVRQTVSEIGEMGSPMRIPFAAMLCAVAACILVCAAALLDLAKATGRSRWPAYLTAFMAVAATGVGIFAFPHPLHNVFGLSELVGYQAPLVLALTWRRDPSAAEVVRLSGWMTAVVWATILINLVPMFRDPVIWPHLKPVYGLAQRALFASWFAWVATVGAQLYRTPRRSAAPA